MSNPKLDVTMLAMPGGSIKPAVLKKKTTFQLGFYIFSCFFYLTHFAVVLNLFLYS